MPQHRPRGSLRCCPVSLFSSSLHLRRAKERTMNPLDSSHLPGPVPWFLPCASLLQKEKLPPSRCLHGSLLACNFSSRSVSPFDPPSPFPPNFPCPGGLRRKEPPEETWFPCFFSFCFFFPSGPFFQCMRCLGPAFSDWCTFLEALSFTHSSFLSSPFFSIFPKTHFFSGI